MGVAAGLALGGYAAPTLACSGVYAMNIGSATETVPANGGAVFSYMCQVGTTGCRFNGLQLFLGEDEVPGTMVQHDQFYTFIPEQPLEVGATYLVSGHGEVVAVDPVPVELDRMELDVSLETEVHRSVPETCCSIPYDSCSNHRCLPTGPGTEAYSLKLATWVGIPMAADPGQTEVSRTEQRFRWTSSNGASGETDWFQSHSAEALLEEAADEYCLIAELRSLIDGSTRTFEEVCVAHGSQPAPGQTADVPFDQTPTAVALACAMPLEGLEELWCEGAAVLCAEGTTDYCERQSEHCDPRPDEPDDPDADSGKGRTPRTGCSTASPGTTSKLALLTPVVLLLLGARRKQRPRSA